jgi:hypothetical protein
MNEDEKEFEEWKRANIYLLMEPFDAVDVNLAMRLSWLESRRTLREQLSKEMQEILIKLKKNSARLDKINRMLNV